MYCRRSGSRVSGWVFPAASVARASNLAGPGLFVTGQVNSHFRQQNGASSPTSLEAAQAVPPSVLTSTLATFDSPAHAQPLIVVGLPAGTTSPSAGRAIDAYGNSVVTGTS